MPRSPSLAPGPHHPRWRRRPPGSNWGDFGVDDKLGRLNTVGPEQVRKGLAEVQDGLTYCLSLPLDQPRGAGLSAHRLPPVLRPTLRAGHVNFNCNMSVAFPGASDVVSDDLVVLHTQFSTQWDAFGHIGARFDADDDGVAEVVYYNGWRGGVDAVATHDDTLAGLSSLGQVDGAAEGLASTSDAGPVDISRMAAHGVQGRAVMIDLEAHVGAARTIVSYQHLRAIMDEDDIVVEPGDILVLHTGFARAFMGGAPPASAGHGAALDGSDLELHEWIRDSGVAAIAADNQAVEAFPAPEHRTGQPVLPLHEVCLFRLGIHLGELWWLSPLAEHLRLAGRSRFLLTAPPLRLAGAVGSPVTPIATV
jgi:kynurenine formamidase